jgi:hypothetical protein
MNLTRKIIVPVITAAAVLAGTSAALAARSATAVTAVAETPAHVAAAAPASPASAVRAVTTVSSAWYYYSNYPTYRACNSEGFYLEIELYAIYTYKCVEVEGYQGDFFVWDLYYQLGHPAGS